MTIRTSYLFALALCTVALGPASADTITEIISQGSSSMTGDVYSQGTRAQNGPWTGDIYSQGMMMSNGQIYSQGMEMSWQDAGPGPQFGNLNWSPPSNTGNTGGNQSSDNSFSPPWDDPVSLVTDAFTNSAGFNPPAGGNPGSNPNPGGNPNRWQPIPVATPIPWQPIRAIPIPAAISRDGLISLITTAATGLQVATEILATMGSREGTTSALTTRRHPTTLIRSPSPRA